jgi:hypothetical protein
MQPRGHVQHDPQPATNSIPKEFLEMLRRQRRIARRVLDIAMPEVSPGSHGVVAIVGELVAAGMAEHVSIRPSACRQHPSVEVYDYN